MEEVEVEVLKAELLERVDKSIEGRFVTVVGVPQLGCDEDVATGSAGTVAPGLDSATASLLVHVPSGRVDVTVACVKRGEDGVFGLLAVGCLVHTKSDLRNFVAIVHVDGALALRHLATTDTLEGRSTVAALHVDVLLSQVDLGLVGRDRNGCHD